MKKIKCRYLLFITTLFVALSLLFALYLYRVWQRPLINPYIPVYFSIAPGKGLKQISHDLAKRGMITHPAIFYWPARLLLLKGHTVKAGNYLLLPKATLWDIYYTFAKGKMYAFQLRLIEGQTFEDWQSLAKKQPLLINDLNGLSLEETRATLKLVWPGVEGVLYPNTYAYFQGESLSTVYEEAAYQMATVMTKIWPTRSPDLPYHQPYQALIVASLVEKETALAQERPLVAGVIVNRLRKGMPLQIDPTLIYGLGPAYHGQLGHREMQTNTPYNTYIHKGLPPTPIAMPSLSSIEAALHPAETGFLYFVAKGDGSNAHQFSTNLKAHNQAVKAYWQRQAQKKANSR